MFPLLAALVCMNNVDHQPSRPSRGPEPKARWSPPPSETRAAFYKQKEALIKSLSILQGKLQ